jgi:hypothetical protein
MTAPILSEEQRINIAVAEEFRVLKSRRDWDNKQIMAMFRKRGIAIAGDRLKRLLAGKSRMTVPELLILESEGMSVSSVKELLQKKTTR